LYKRTVNLSFVPKEARDTISRQRGGLNRHIDNFVCELMKK
jgi:hypothetical protein